MATTDYRTATTSPRNATTPINRPTGDRNEVSRANSKTAIWIIVAIVALAAIAFSMGMFGGAEMEEQQAVPMTSQSVNPDDTSATTSPMTTPQTTVTPSETAPGAAVDTNTAPAAVNE